MVVGNGLLGMSFLLSSENDNESRVIFASGVSNSKETDIKEFNREKELILERGEINKRDKFDNMKVEKMEAIRQMFLHNAVSDIGKNRTHIIDGTLDEDTIFDHILKIITLNKAL